MTRKIELAPGVEVVLIEAEPDDICEQCGVKDELRPYGKRMESGRRMRLCFDCAMKDQPEADRAIKEMFDGEERGK